MKILDTSALDFMAKSGLTVAEACMITPDIQDEFEAGHNVRLPKAIRSIFELDDFDRALYLKSYKAMLNVYGKQRFYNLGGFGDISILALLGTQREAAAVMLPGLSESIEVVTGDAGLIKKINREFRDTQDPFSRNLQLTSPETYFGV